MDDLGTPIWSRSIPFLLVYFAPVLIGAWRRSQNREASWPAWALFLVVFFTGMTVIGWLFALRKAFKDKPLPDWLTRPASYGGQGGGPVLADGTATEEPQRCTGCGGTGGGTCSVCGGVGTWYEAGNQRSCYACNGTGRTTCYYCGGSGRK